MKLVEMIGVSSLHVYLHLHYLNSSSVLLRYGMDQRLEVEVDELLTMISVKSS
jgi:hypothetical protein